MTLIRFLLEADMQEILLFVCNFVFVFLMYQIFVVYRAKHAKKKKEPIEVLYLKQRYKIDLDKIYYPQLLQIVAIISSLDIALVVSIIMLIHSFIWEIIIGFFSLFIIIFISYHIVYLFYKKKGMIRNE